MKWSHETKEKIQYLFAGLAFFFGLILVAISALFIEPLGEVHATIITVFGLILTFVGAIFGINFHYNNEVTNFKSEILESIRKENQKANEDDTEEGE